MRLFLAAATLALVPAVASAASYSAKPAAPVASHKIITRDISWACGTDSCLGSTDQSRPVVLCQDLAKKAGRIEAFTVNGRALAAEELAKCNTAARGGTAAQALARN